MCNHIKIKLRVTTCKYLGIYIYKGNNDVMIKNEENVPELWKNLLSVQQKTKLGNQVIFDKDSCTILKRNGDIIGFEIAINDL